MKFLASIRERRLFQIVAGYAAVGWVALEVVDQFVQNGVLPPFVYGTALIWFLGGLVAALVIGWFHGERGDQKAPAFEIGVLAVLGLLVMGFTGTRVTTYVSNQAALAAAAESALDLRRVAVAYFRDLGPDGDSQHIADGLTEDLIAQLAKVRALDVVSRNGSAQFRGMDVSIDSIARALEAGTIVDGTVEQVGERVRVNVRLVDGQSGAEFRRASFERPMAEILTASDELVEETARFLREWLGDEIRIRRQEEAARNLDAWSLVQRGERARKEAEMRLRRDEPEEAVAAFDSADELLARAQIVAPAWPEPSVLRAQIAYRRARISHDAHEIAAWIEHGLEQAEHALGINPEHAAALEIRGTIRYFHSLLPLIPDPQQREALMASGRKDLEEAVRRDPALAAAHATLSHLYFYSDDINSGVLAAQRAYEEDAYLDASSTVLGRLVGGTYDMQAFDQTKRWCLEGFRRFPADPRFSACQVLILTTPIETADVERGWRLIAQVDSVAFQPQQEIHRAKARIYMGGVLARAGLPDSADAVLRRGRAEFRPEMDPRRELYLAEAAFRANLLGDVDGAIDLLKQFAAANPDFGFEHHWWWRDVRRHPRYSELAPVH